MTKLGIEIIKNIRGLLLSIYKDIFGKKSSDTKQ
jgi:hypothetical protein